MGYPEAMSSTALNGYRARLIEETVKALDVLALLDEMAPDLLRINPAAAETAALAMVRVKSRMSRLSDNFWAMTLD